MLLHSCSPNPRAGPNCQNDSPSSDAEVASATSAAPSRDGFRPAFTRRDGAGLSHKFAVSGGSLRGGGAGVSPGKTIFGKASNCSPLESFARFLTSRLRRIAAAPILGEREIRGRIQKGGERCYLCETSGRCRLEAPWLAGTSSCERASLSDGLGGSEGPVGSRAGEPRS